VTGYGSDGVWWLDMVVMVFGGCWYSVSGYGTDGVP
jgi:hypothetical protein